MDVFTFIICNQITIAVIIKMVLIYYVSAKKCQEVVVGSHTYIELWL